MWGPVQRVFRIVVKKASGIPLVSNNRKLHINYIEEAGNAMSNESAEAAEPKTTHARSRYACGAYWDSRFASQISHGGSLQNVDQEWYCGWEELSEVVGDCIFGRLPPRTIDAVQSHGIGRRPNLLIVGSGVSQLGLEISEEGWFQHIVHIDISKRATNFMKERYNAQSQGDTGGVCIEWLEMDAANMTFEDNSFDFVIDKGTADALRCGGLELVVEMVTEVGRVLKPSGTFVLISHSGWDKHQQLFNWSTGRADSCRVDASKVLPLSRTSPRTWFWSLVVDKKARLNSSATFVNILRAHFPDQPLGRVIKNPQTAEFQDAMAEYRKVMLIQSVYKKLRVRALRRRQTGGAGTPPGCDVGGSKQPFTAVDSTRGEATASKSTELRPTESQIQTTEEGKLDCHDIPQSSTTEISLPATGTIADGENKPRGKMPLRQQFCCVILVEKGDEQIR
eukprot:GHVN01089515.1.p1 GENE.GHVN01089515.1~~GHVN01089515.1.p1  ORF type:complete len:451 (+),score=58.74 GHVN01089515.1:713-2065(+)